MVYNPFSLTPTWYCVVSFIVAWQNTDRALAIRQTESLPVSLTVYYQFIRQHGKICAGTKQLIWLTSWNHFPRPTGSKNLKICEMMGNDSYKPSFLMWQCIVKHKLLRYLKEQAVVFVSQIYSKKKLSDAASIIVLDMFIKLCLFYCPVDKYNDVYVRDELWKVCN